MIRNSLFLAIVVLVTGCSGEAIQSPFGQPISPASSVAQPDTSTNRLGNPGFEKPLDINVITCGTKPQAPGNWQPYAQTNGMVPFRESGVVHAGSFSLEVQTPAAANCGGDGVYQDFPAFSMPTSYTYSYWAMPSVGTENQSVFYSWDHVGTVVASDDVHISPTQTLIDAWGTEHALPAVTYGVWHQFVYTVDAVTLTATLKVDGKVLGSTPTGTADQNGPVTVWDGQEAGAPANPDQFYYDTFLFDTTAHPKKATPNAEPQGVTNQKITITGMNFSPDAAVSISGTGVTVTSTTITNATKIVIFIDVSGSAPTGARDITVTESGGNGTCTGCFTIT